MKGTRTGNVGRMDKIKGIPVQWSFRHLSRQEGELIAAVEVDGFWLTGRARVVTRFLEQAMNPEVIWRELCRQAVSNVKSSLLRLRQAL